MAPERRRWFDRQFVPGHQPDAIPDLVERLRGTPLRARERIAHLPAGVVGERPKEGWSPLEHVGHLLDLEQLWSGRLTDFAAGCPELRAADLENRATWEADHNRSSPEAVLDAFEAARHGLLNQIDAMTHDVMTRSARHPRLLQEMSVADLLYFVAEHDDHHLAAVTALGQPDRTRPTSASSGSE